MDDFKHLYINKNLSSYVQVYDNALDTDVCHSLIQSFDSDVDHQQLRENQYMYFMENNISRNQWHMPEVYQTLLNYQVNYLQDSQLNVLMLTTEGEFEEVRMRKYRASLGDHFYPHVDVVGNRTQSRLLTYHLFLNDASSGNLEFLQLDRDVSIEPRQGRLVIFPSTWQYLHRVNEAMDDDVYVINSHFHGPDIYKDKESEA